MELVNDIPGIKCSEPEGAFYIFPDVSSYYGKSDGQKRLQIMPMIFACIC